MPVTQTRTAGVHRRESTRDSEGGEIVISVYVAKLRDLLTRTVQEEAGQGLSEYALILFLVAIVAIAALTLLGHDIVSVLSSVANTI
jgi:Flp pilus assembly pilin Flp